MFLMIPSFSHRAAQALPKTPGCLTISDSKALSLIKHIYIL